MILLFLLPILIERITGEFDFGHPLKDFFLKLHLFHSRWLLDWITLRLKHWLAETGSFHSRERIGRWACLDASFGEMFLLNFSFDEVRSISWDLLQYSSQTLMVSLLSFVYRWSMLLLNNVHRFVCSIWMNRRRWRRRSSKRIDFFSLDWLRSSIFIWALINHWIERGLCSILLEEIIFFFWSV